MVTSVLYKSSPLASSYDQGFLGQRRGLISRKESYITLQHEQHVIRKQVIQVPISIVVSMDCEGIKQQKHHLTMFHRDVSWPS